MDVKNVDIRPQEDQMLHALPRDQTMMMHGTKKLAIMVPLMLTLHRVPRQISASFSNRGGHTREVICKSR